MVASITINDRLPHFWTDSPRLWFAQFEAIVAPQKQGDDYKYNAVVSKLPKEVIQQVSDILTTPPETGKYSALKEQLIGRFEESEHRRFHKLLAEMSLGDQTPSQLLRKMKEAGNGKMNDDTIRLLWLRQLPTAVTTVLAVTDGANLDKLSEMADRIYENIVCSTHSRRSATAEIDLITSLTSQLAAVRLEIAELRNERRRSFSRDNNYVRSRFDRSRSRSRSRGRNNNKYCYYHRRFKLRAHKCVPPCSWKNEETSEN